VNSQLSKEINFEILFRNRTYSNLRNFEEEISFMERCYWSVSQCLQTSNEASTMLAFESVISSVKVLTFERKISKKNFEINF